MNKDKPIIEQHVNIVDKTKHEDLDYNVKLLEWSERNFHTKVLEKISSAIALRQFDLATKVESVKKVLENIFSLYTKLYDVNLFTQEVQRVIDQLQGDLQLIGTTLNLSPSESQIDFQMLLPTQGKLAKLQAQGATIKAIFISI